ncbi:hypothetical protein XOCgx_4706 [Xanthomonas oryzae pv. oryzicola]|nr:hypothetical protein XOCgx_4706 [Xanthomonas oryzae pv. oryzicola]
MGDGVVAMQHGSGIGPGRVTERPDASACRRHGCCPAAARRMSAPQPYATNRASSQAHAGSVSNDNTML